jgi:hypothetical protein
LLNSLALQFIFFLFGRLGLRVLFSLYTSVFAINVALVQFFFFFSLSQAASGSYCWLFGYQLVIPFVRGVSIYRAPAGLWMDYRTPPCNRYPGKELLKRGLPRFLLCFSIKIVWRRPSFSVFKRLFSALSCSIVLTSFFT